MVMKIILVAFAGSLGTLARYALSSLTMRFAPAGFPWGTLLVNVLGCFIMGFLFALFKHKLSPSTEVQTIALVGFMGAFTTFSAFALETGELFRNSGYLIAAGNILLQNVVGIAALFAGLAIGRLS